MLCWDIGHEILGPWKVPPRRLIRWSDEYTGVRWQGDPALVDRWGFEEFRLIQDRRRQPDPEADDSEDDD